jgi:hypothetical protein
MDLLKRMIYCGQEKAKTNWKAKPGSKTTEGRKGEKTGG